MLLEVHFPPNIDVGTKEAEMIFPSLPSELVVDLGRKSRSLESQFIALAPTPHCLQYVYVTVET